MIERHLMKLRARDDISQAEEQAIREAISECREISARTTFIQAGDFLNHSTLLLDGFMCRYRDMQKGDRQISEIHVAGDFADLHSYTLRKLDHSMMTLSECRVALVPHANLQRLTEQFPRLARIYWFLTNLDAAIHREWEVTLGRRSAVSGIAALFCELLTRLELVGLAQGPSYSFPLTQEQLGECLGLTAVHINRSLRELRERGLATFQGNVVSIQDLAGLKALAEFDDAYLYVDVKSH